jgi:hypothetical protein
MTVRLRFQSFARRDPQAREPSCSLMRPRGSGPPRTPGRHRLRHSGSVDRRGCAPESRSAVTILRPFLRPHAALPPGIYTARGGELGGLRAPSFPLPRCMHHRQPGRSERRIVPRQLKTPGRLAMESSASAWEPWVVGPLSGAAIQPGHHEAEHATGELARALRDFLVAPVQPASQP